MQMKSRLQRWGNKRAILACVDPLCTWIAAGDRDLRLKCIRNLTLDPETSLPPGEESGVDDLVQQCQHLVVQFLVDFASGKVKPGEVNKKDEVITKRQRPYANSAGQDIDAFKSVSPAAFGITLSSVYPFLAEDASLWKQRCKIAAHPLPAFWPVNVMKRFIHFIDTLYDKVPGVFENYEQEGGEYFQSEEEEEDSDEESDDACTEEDDCDDVFA